MSGVVLFTDKGERVPVFYDKLGIEGAPPRGIRRCGWRQKRTWQPKFFAERWGKRHWRLWRLESASPVTGSILEQSAGPRFAKSVIHPIQRWPHLAAIEMYLRHLHASL